MGNKEILIDIINQIYSLQEKIKDNKFERNFKKIFEGIENLNLRIHNPIGETYDLSRLDCEANFIGENIEKEQVIIEVLKPAIYEIIEGNHYLIQKAIVFTKEK